MRDVYFHTYWKYVTSIKYCVLFKNEKKIAIQRSFRVVSNFKIRLHGDTACYVAETTRLCHSWCLHMRIDLKSFQRDLKASFSSDESSLAFLTLIEVFEYES